MRFNDPNVSRKHVLLHVNSEEVIAEDCGSRNGTLVNGSPLRAVTVLKDGDELVIGSRRLKIQITEGDLSFDRIRTDTMHTMPKVGPPQVSQLLSWSGKDVQQCPQCKMDVGVEDEICASCGHAWSDFRPMSVTQRLDLKAIAGLAKMERRRHARHEVSIPVLYHSKNLTVETCAIDLSRSGTFIRTQILDSLGTECSLTMLADGGPALALQGTVVRTVDQVGQEDPVGMGIQFKFLDHNVKIWLDETIARVQSPPEE